jgi:hypothetical protein
MQLTFGKPSDNGGTNIIGYQLWKDEGIAGSPFTMIFNGTSKPEIVSYNVTGLTADLTY